MRGANFASQDYLSLSSHPELIEEASRAARELGVHSAGSAALMGLTDVTLRLERGIADWLGYAEATVFPTGWGAGYGVIKALVRPDDHVLIDILAHACLHEGATAATRNVHVFPHVSAKGLAARLSRVRSKHPEAGILVVTESLFSMDADTPDLKHAVAVCKQYGATLLVDCAHDLGAMGADGRGLMSDQGVLGEVDIVMGSFSKTFASNGGFVASNHPALKPALRFTCGPQTFTNAISPLQAAVVLKALEIIRGSDGAARREKLMANVSYLRAELSAKGFELLGAPSPIVPTVLGDIAMSRLICGEVLDRGALVNLVEYPAVARNKSRLRLQAMADHDRGSIDSFVKVLCKARTAGRDRMKSILGLSQPK